VRNEGEDEDENEDEDDDSNNQGYIDHTRARTHARNASKRHGVRTSDGVAK
jgi:hypothetical protein